MMTEAMAFDGDFLPDHIIIEKLKEAEREAADPSVKRLSHEEVFGKLRKKYSYEV
ncbi:MAG: hypothetical protein FWC89_04440 [Defluviitaleaceae bacterium]|nr:hypothetical protein [Defluviitaleaceae bacterium]